MRRSQFSEEQIIRILKEHQAGLGVKELCRQHGISDATFYKWRSKYGAMEVSDGRHSDATGPSPMATRPKALEAANAKLKSVRGPSPRWGGESPDHAGGADAGHGQAQGNARKKLLSMCHGAPSVRATMAHVRGDVPWTGP